MMLTTRLSDAFRKGLHRHVVCRSLDTHMPLGGYVHGQQLAFLRWPPQSQLSPKPCTCEPITSISCSLFPGQGLLINAGDKHLTVQTQLIPSQNVSQRLKPTPQNAMFLLACHYPTMQKSNTQGLEKNQMHIIHSVEAFKRQQITRPENLRAEAQYTKYK